MKDIKLEIDNSEFLKLLLESIGNGIFILDINGKIIAWNPVMEKITVYSLKEIKGKSCQIFNFTRCFDQDCHTRLKGCGILEFGKVEPTEYLLNHKNGHALSVTKNARVIKNRDNKIIGIVETVTDLTALKNARLKM